MAAANPNSKLRIIRLAIHGALALILIAMVHFAHSYWLSTVQGNRHAIANEIDTIKKKLEDTDTVSAEHARLVDLKKSIELRTDSIEDRIPEQTNEGEFLKQM